jgi:hypothetical protein
VPGKTHYAALLASARVALLLAGAITLGASVAGGVAIIAAAVLSWGASVVLGVNLYRAGQRDTTSTSWSGARARALESTPSYGSTRPRLIA